MTGILSSWRCVVCGFAISSGADVGIAISDWAYLVLDGIFSMTQVVRDKRLSPYLHKILVKVFSKDLHLFMNSLSDPSVNDFLDSQSNLKRKLDDFSTLWWLVYWLFLIFNVFLR